MQEFSTVAAVDLGSNSFRLQVARVVDDQFYPLDSLKETVRLAAGLTEARLLDSPSRRRAIACLKRFSERLRGLPPGAVRVVGTNTLRVARNAPAFLKAAEAALGFPIEIIAGQEEARLIHLGVAHSLPASDAKRLVVDIGGGSAEFIIGTRFRPLAIESLYIGCVGYSQRYFPDGKITPSALERAELAARAEVQAIAGEFSAGHWDEAIGSSGTARTLAEILEQNGFSETGITPAGLEKLRAAMIKAGNTRLLQLPGLPAERVPVLAGGFAIMAAIFRELGIRNMSIAGGALREGVLWDLLGRIHHHDLRETTVKQFVRRYHVDTAQAKRVETLAVMLLNQLEPAIRADLETAQMKLAWAAQLHEIGISISHAGYHKHSAYIIANADMPGFSRMEQARLSLLVRAHRGSLAKLTGMVKEGEEWAAILALRLAALFYRSRTAPELPAIRLRMRNGKISLALPRAWLQRNPLTETLLENEAREWKAAGMELVVGAEKR